MKRTKREQNSIVINVLLFGFLTIILAYFSYSYIYPNMIEIEATKAEVKDIYEQKKQKEKTGINYKDFQSSYKSVLTAEKNVDSTNVGYKESITKSIDENFFETYFTNKTDSSFSAFMETLKSSVQGQDEDAAKNTKKINFILPSYVTNIVDIDADFDETAAAKDIHFLTDFRFVNYIETLMDEFNLSYNNPIGISDITLLQDYAVSDSGTTLDKNIYYIPVELDLKGEKRYVLLFLYYLEHVGNILVDNVSSEVTILDTEIVANNNVTKSIKNDKKKQSLSEEKKVIEAKKKEPTESIDGEVGNTPSNEETSTGKDQKEADSMPQDKKEKNIIYKSSLFNRLAYIKINDYPEKKEGKKHNVFNNQVIDIESISFSNYIDSNPSFGALLGAEENNLISNISQQLKDEFHFKVKLRFYVKGLPKYKIEELIDQTVALYETLKKEVTASMSNKDIDRGDKERIRDIHETLKAISDQLNQINTPKKGQALTLTEKYNKSYEVKRLLLEIEEKFNEIIK